MATTKHEHCKKSSVIFQPLWLVIWMVCIPFSLCVWIIITNCVHIYNIYIHNYYMRTSERSKYRVKICFSTRNVIIMYLHNVFGMYTFFVNIHLGSHKKYVSAFLLSRMNWQIIIMFLVEIHTNWIFTWLKTTDQFLQWNSWSLISITIGRCIKKVILSLCIDAPNWSPSKPLARSSTDENSSSTHNNPRAQIDFCLMGTPRTNYIWQCRLSMYN